MTEAEIKEITISVLDAFEELLDNKNITVPCADEDEEIDRLNDDNSARLYGMEYWQLEEKIRDIIANGCHHS